MAVRTLLGTTLVTILHSVPISYNTLGEIEEHCATISLPLTQSPLWL